MTPPSSSDKSDERETLYSVSQVAAELDISEQRVRALAASRQVGRRIGARVLVFTATDVEALRERRPGRPRTKPAEPTE